MTRFLACLLLLGGLSTAAPAMAQDDESTPAAAESAYADSVPVGEFRSVDPDDRESTVSAPKLVTAAYALMWFFAAMFMFSLWRSSRRNSAALAVAEARLAELDSLIAQSLSNKA